MKKNLILLCISTVILFTSAVPASIKHNETKKSVARARVPVKVWVYINNQYTPAGFAKVTNAITNVSTTADFNGVTTIEVQDWDTIRGWYTQGWLHYSGYHIVTQAEINKGEIVFILNPGGGTISNLF